MAHKQHSMNTPGSLPEPDAHPSLPPLPISSLNQQIARKIGAYYQRPDGFDRYRYMGALLDGMPTLGGWDDNGGGNPDRFRPVPENLG